MPKHCNKSCKSNHCQNHWSVYKYSRCMSKAINSSKRHGYRSWTKKSRAPQDAASSDAFLATSIAVYVFADLPSTTDLYRINTNHRLQLYFLFVHITGGDILVLSLSVALAFVGQCLPCSQNCLIHSKRIHSPNRNSSIKRFNKDSKSTVACGLCGVCGAVCWSLQ